MAKHIMQEPEIDKKLVIHREPEMRKEGVPGAGMLVLIIPMIIYILFNYG